MIKKKTLSIQKSSLDPFINKPTAALYVRVSTEDQAKHGYSIQAQEEALINYAKALGYEIYKIYKDEGISAKDMKHRPAMQELLRDAEQQKFAAIFIYKLDRFSRSIIDIILTIDKLKQWNVDFISLQDRIETASATGKLNLHIISAFAEFERNVTSERTKFTMDKKARDGSFMSKAPIGYVYLNKKLEINLENAEKVRTIFKQYLETDISLTKLAKMNGFTTSGLIKLLKNKTYLGIVKFDEEEYKGTHEAIIDQSLFDSVQQKLNKNTAIIDVTLE